MLQCVWKPNCVFLVKFLLFIVLLLGRLLFSCCRGCVSLLCCSSCCRGSVSLVFLIVSCGLLAAFVLVRRTVIAAVLTLIVFIIQIFGSYYLLVGKTTLQKITTPEVEMA